MRTRFTWIVAILALVAIGFLMACSSKYSSSNNGLIVVPTQGSLVMQSFSLDLGNGHISQINNVNGPPTNGIPSAVVLDPAGAVAYLIVSENSSVAGSATGVETFQVASDGKLASGNTTTLNSTIPMVNVACVTPTGTQIIPVTVQATPVVPGSLAIDSGGKYLFVADTATSGQTQPYDCNGATVTSTVNVPGTVSVLTVSSGTLTEVAGSPFALPAQTTVGSGSIGATANASALAVTPTVYPPLYSPCSLHTPPTTENLYVTDSVNSVLLNYSVDTSTGALTPVSYSATASGISTGSQPSGVAVDPCNRFVYVSNNAPPTVSAFTICSVVSQNCQLSDFSLQPVTGSPFAVSPGEGPGPLAVDPYGSFLYVVDNGSSQVSAFRIGSSSGSLTSVATYSTNTPPSLTFPNSIAIRSDDSWMFVANYTSSTVTQYAITPATGVLTLQQSFTTLNNPTGVAVK